MLADEAPALLPATREALDIWRLMGRSLRVEALPTVLELCPVDDVELLLDLLTVIDARTPRM